MNCIRQSVILLITTVTALGHSAATRDVQPSDRAAAPRRVNREADDQPSGAGVSAQANEGVKPTQAKPAGAKSEIRHSVLMAGRPAGLRTSTRSGDGAWRFVFEYNDRGRGPSLTERVVLGSDGIPRSIEIDGHDYLKNQVLERFGMAAGKASWKNSAERGTRVLPAGAPGFYLGFDGVPAELGLLARALLTAREKTLAILPEGQARIERLGKLEVRADGAARSVTHYEVSGLSFTPTPVWLDADGEIFAQGSEWTIDYPRRMGVGRQARCWPRRPGGLR